MTNSYCQPTEANFWFPVAPGVTSLPANPLPTTNPVSMPANAVAAPVGFDESNPDLCELFETILPTGVDPIYPVTVNPAQSVPPYQETVFYNLRVRVLSSLETFNYSTGAVTEIVLALRTKFGQGVSYPSQVNILTRLTAEVLVDFRDYQEAFLGISLKNNTISRLLITPKVLIHFNGDRQSQQIFDQMGYATIDPGSARITDSLSKFHGSSGRIYAPNDKIKITYPGPAMTLAGAWAVDFWFYIPASTAKSTYCLYSFNNNSGSASGVYLYDYPGNTYNYIRYYVNETQWNYSYESGSLLDYWNYCVLIKYPNSSAINAYINGISRSYGDYANAYNMWNDTSVHSLGGDFRDAIDRSLNGWLAEFRQIDSIILNTGVLPVEPYEPLSNDWHIKITTSLKIAVEYVVLTIISEAVIVIKLKISNFLDKFVQIVKYTGNNTSGRVINTSSLAPHFISIRSGYNAVFFDKSRGANYFSYWSYYYPWLLDTNTVQSFGAESFTLGNGYLVNSSGYVYHATVFGNTNIDYVDTSGGVSTTIATNKDWGFSVVRYTGVSANPIKIPHGLAAAPALIFAMWDSYYSEHTHLWGTAVGATNSWIQNSMYANSVIGTYTSVNYDSTYININSNNYLNAPGNATTLYCFTSSPGRTKIGTYNGYSEIDTYVQTNFKPTHIMIRRKFGANNNIAWRSYDKTLGESFDPFGTEAAIANTTVVFGTNGFTVLANSNQNVTGSQYIYYAMRGPLQEEVLQGESLSLSTANSSTQLQRQVVANAEAYGAQLGGQDAELFSYTYLMEGEPSATEVAGGATGNTPAFVAADVFSMQLGAIDTNLRVSDIYYNNTSLLLHMDGANNSTTFTDTSINQFTVTANGGAKISTVQSKFGGTSGAFDGNGDNLSIADNAAFEFGGGDFTIEMWAYVTANKGYQAFMNKSHTAADGSGWILYTETDNNVYFRAGNSGSWTVALNSATIPTLNTWQHYAVTRNGTTWRLFIDGVLKASTTNSLSMTDGTLPLYIGRYPYFPGANSAQDFSGYIDEVRITRGVARYVAAFTPTNRAFFDTVTAEDPSFSSVSLLMHMDGANGSTSFVDSSDSMLDLTANGNVQLSTALSKFGGASALFDGTGDFLSRAYDARFDFVLSDFTFEAWIRPTAFRTTGTRIMSTGGGTVGWNSTTGIHTLIQLDPTGKVNLQLSNNTGTPVSVVSTNGVSLNVWSLISVSVSGSNAYIAVGGVSSTHALATRAKPSTNPQIAIGTIPGEAGAVATAFVGNMDEVRLTKGVARYTSSYTPPVGPFPSF